MIETDLFDDILVKPVTDGADKLCVVSGYATPGMASQHFDKINDLKLSLEVELLVGMCPLDGLAVTNHIGFQQLVTGKYSSQFKCSYVFTPPAVHSKVYVWLKGNVPVQSFVGSANYTQTAFGTKQREVLTKCDPVTGLAYFTKVSAETIYCTHGDVENLITIYSDRQFVNRKKKTSIAEATEALQTVPEVELTEAELRPICISFLANDGELKQVSGLNWGQREGRRGNEAYIRVPASVGHTDFFPELRTHFTVLTDDNKVIICTRAQSEGKAIHSPNDNAEIGLYFRRRLSVEPGVMILKEDLERYGRTDVCFTKIDEETFFMDFSNAR